MIAIYNEPVSRHSLILKLCSLVTAVLMASACSNSAVKPLDSDANNLDEKISTEAPKAIDPLTVKAYKQAITLLDEGKLSDAEKLLSGIVASNDKLAAPFYNLGVIAEHDDNWEKAKIYYNRALDADGSYYLALNNLGVISRSEGNFKAAMNFYKKGVKVNPDSSELQYNLGVLNELYLHNYGAAVEHYERYLALVDNQDERVESWVADLKRRSQ